MIITNKIIMEEKPLDLRKRKKLASLIEDLNIEIKDKDLFISNMEDYNYELLGNNFLIKEIGNKEVNLTLDGNTISTLSVYENDESVDVDPNILNEVISDIEECNIE